LEIIVEIPIFLILVIYGVPLVFGKDITVDALENVVFGTSMLCSMYLFELCYKTHSGIPLLVHHLVTLILVSLAIYRYDYNQNVVNLQNATLLGLTAVTEEFDFVALIMYRMHHRKTVLCLRISALSSLLIKTFLIACSIPVWIDGNVSLLFVLVSFVHQSIKQKSNTL
jgi:hypothetical protein